MNNIKKKYLIDTSVIIDNPALNLKAIYQEGQNDIFITEVVLQELDKHKISINVEVGSSARSFFRSVQSNEFQRTGAFELKNKHDSIYQTELNFEELNSPIKIFIINRKEKEYVISKSEPNDLKILEIAKDYNLTLITNDISFKVIAISEGVKAESLKINEVSSPEKIDFLFEYNIEESVLNNPLTERIALENIYKNQKKWNQIVINECKDSVPTGKKRFYIVNGIGLLKAKSEESDFKDYVVKPKNLEQKFYAELLSMPFNVLAVTGSTGSGKTLLAVQEGIRRVQDPKSPIDGIVYMRYTVNTTDKHAELGFRAGGEDEKLSYFNYPLNAAINFYLEKEIKNKKNKEDCEKSGIYLNEFTTNFMKENNIVVTDIAHTRGITLSKKFVIFDEIQNAPNSILQLIGTRIGQDTVIVLMGDFRQVDHPYLSKTRNSLVTLLNVAEKDPMVTAIQLKSTIRSEIAEWFQENIK